MRYSLITDNPRKMLLPVAKAIPEDHKAALAECQAKNLTEAVKHITEAIETVKGMFPELTDDRLAAAANSRTVRVTGGAPRGA